MKKHSPWCRSSRWLFSFYLGECAISIINFHSRCLHVYKCNLEAVHLSNLLQDQLIRGGTGSDTIYLKYGVLAETKKIYCTNISKSFLISLRPISWNLLHSIRSQDGILPLWKRPHPNQCVVAASTIPAKASPSKCHDRDSTETD